MVQIVNQSNYTEQVWLCGTDTVVNLPNGLNAPGGVPIAAGFQISCIDNAGTAGTTTITIRGQIASTSTTGSQTITTNFGSQTFFWSGLAWSAAVQ